MNTQVFVLGTLTPTKLIDTLLPGEMGIYCKNKDTGRLENATASSNCNEFFVAQAKKSGVIVNAREIQSNLGTLKGPRPRNFELKKIVYRVPVKQTYVLTTGYKGQSQDDEFEVKIEGNALYTGFYNIENFVKTYSVVGQFATQLALYTALANAINADNPLVDSVRATNAGLEVVAKVGQVINLTFNVFQASTVTSGLTSVQTTINQVTDGDVGAGTPDEVMRLCVQYSPWSGQMYSDSRLFNNTQDDYVIDTTAGYNCYHVKWTNSNQIDESQAEAAFNVWQQVFIYAPNTVNMNYLEQVYEGLMAKPFRVVSSL